MENFKPQKFSPSNLNGGFRYENGDIVDASAINTPIEASYYAQEVADAANAKAQSALDYVFSEGGINPLAVYPIGSIYLSVSKTSPAEIFGGEWEQIKDKFLLASGDKYTDGSTGGSADAVAVKHTHNFIGTGGQIGGYDSAHLYRYNSNVTYKNPAWSYGSYGSGDGYVSIKETGVDGAGKNMPPYIVVSVWQRTA